MAVCNDISLTCRTCGTENRGMISISCLQRLEGVELKICEVIMKCTSVQVEKGDGLPENICLDCFNQLRQMFLFQKLCEDTNKKLRMILLEHRTEDELFPVYIELEDQMDCKANSTETNVSSKVQDDFQDIETEEEQVCIDVVEPPSCTARVITYDGEARYEVHLELTHDGNNAPEQTIEHEATRNDNCDAAQIETPEINKRPDEHNASTNLFSRSFLEELIKRNSAHEKQYKCDNCKYICTDEDSLISHKKNHENQSTRKDVIIETPEINKSCDHSGVDVNGGDKSKKVNIRGPELNKKQVELNRKSAKKRFLKEHRQNNTHKKRFKPDIHKSICTDTLFSHNEVEIANENTSDPVNIGTSEIDKRRDACDERRGKEKPHTVDCGSKKVDTIPDHNMNPDQLAKECIKCDICNTICVDMCSLTSHMKTHWEDNSMIHKDNCVKNTGQQKYKLNRIGTERQETNARRHEHGACSIKSGLSKSDEKSYDNSHEDGEEILTLHTAKSELDIGATEINMGLDESYEHNIIEYDGTENNESNIICNGDAREIRQNQEKISVETIKTCPLKENQQNITRKKHFKCGICIYICTNENIFNGHMKTHYVDMRIRNDESELVDTKTLESEKTCVLSSDEDENIRREINKTPNNCYELSSDEEDIRTTEISNGLNKSYEELSSHEDNDIVHMTSADIGTNKMDKRKYECRTITKYSSKKRILGDKQIIIQQQHLQCYNCKYVCTNKGTLTAHMKIHRVDEEMGRSVHIETPQINKGNRKPDKHVNTRFKCDVCTSTYTRRAHLARHQLLHREGTPFKCATCEYSCKRKDTLAKHERTHTNPGKRVTCNICGHICPNAKCLISHKGAHRAKQQFKCSLCKYITTDKSLLVKHEKVHKKMMRCDKCKFTCTLQVTMTQHIMTHSPQDTFKCDSCEYSTTRKYHLVRHEMTHNKSFKCNHCTFTGIWTELTEHKKVHSINKLYKCDECGYTNARNDRLVEHKMIHSKPFKCNSCKFSGTREELAKHRKVQHPYKLFKCDECGYNTTWENSFNRHKLVHIGEKRFK